MAKGRKPAPRRGASRPQQAQARRVPGFVWLIAGLAIGAFVMLLMRLEPGNNGVQRQADAPGNSRQNSRPPTPPPAVKPAADKPRFEFYTLLPESEVASPGTSSTPAPTPTETPPEVAAPQGNFFLQAGSFRQEAEANRVRASLLLLGFDVQLENVRINGDPWYRVHVGPFASRELAGNAQKTLSGNGYNNLLLQQRKTGG